MHRIKIKLTTPEMTVDFIDTCTGYQCDVNVYDGSKVIDAKSLVGVFSIEQGKVIEVKAISSNEEIIVNFIRDMEKFKYRG